MRTNLNSTSMRNTCPEFPLFGANDPDATCIDGILYDLDNVGDDGVLIKPLEEIPCPFCRTEEFIRYDPFNKEYSMDSEEDIRDWYMNQILEYWGEDTGILIGITMVYERHLWNEEVKVI